MKRQESGIIRGQTVLPWLLVFALAVACNAYAGDITIDGDMNVASNLHVQGALSAAHPATNANEVARKGEMDAAISNKVHSVLPEFRQATNTLAVAENASVTATGAKAHAEGDSTAATGVASHAEGSGTIAAGAASHAAGENAQAAHNNAYVWSDGTPIASATNKQYTVYATNGIRLMGGVTEVENAAEGKDAVNYHTMIGYVESVAFSGSFNDLTDVPADLANGDDDSRWNGGATGLDAAAGRASLGLGSAATNDASDFALTDEAVDYQMMRDYVGWITFSGSFNDLTDVPAGLADGDDDSRWNGGATPEFNPAAGRTSLGLGSAAIMSANAFAPAHLAAYAGNNLTYSSNKFHALPGYTDPQAIAAIQSQWPNLDTDNRDDTRWDGGANGLNAVAGRTSLGLGTAAIRDAIAFAPSDLAPYAGNNVTYSNGQFHAGIDITSFIMPPQGNLSMGVYTNMPPM